MSFNQKEYIADYNKNYYKMYQFRVRKDNKKVIEFLDGLKSKNGYIIEMIENDINPSSVLTIKEIKEKIMPILYKHKIFEIYLFGSYSRGEANKNSDVDIYCEPGDVLTLYNQIDLEEELETALGKKVDLIFTEAKLDDYFEAQLRKDMIKLC